MMKKIFNFIDCLSIRKKLLLTYFVLIVGPLAFFTFLTYSRVSNVVSNQTLMSATQVFNETKSVLEKNFRNIKNVITIITQDNLIYEVASKSPENYDAVEQLKDSTSITSMFTYLQESSDIDSIKLYVNNRFVFAKENIHTFSIENIQDSKWYRILSGQKNNTLWCPPTYFDGDTNVFSAVRIIYNVNKLQEKLALIRVDIDVDRVKAALDNTALTKNSVVFVTDGENILLSNTTPEKSAFWNIKNEQIQTLQQATWNKINIKGQNAVINLTELAGPEWYLVSIIPQKDIIRTSARLKTEMLLLMLIIAMISYILAYFISNSSTKRISKLINEMRKVSSGNLNVSLSNTGNDEINELIQNFNNMTTRISILMDEKYKMGQEIKSTELKALQAQINPHFLYNSLDLINCIAIKHNIPDIITMVNALAKFYKLSLSGGKDIVSIADEMEHAKLYIKIQNLRFENRINLELDIDHQLYDYSILKILLQPLIENSILHGIFEKESKTGTIIIKGALCDEVITLSIQDDGVGMSEEKIHTLLSNCEESKSKGYGVKNINNRIKLHYGERYGLTYISSPGKGTEVELCIPAVKI